jgi:hypothetical protein
MSTSYFTIEKLARPIREGDWHDAPLRWEVRGPEVQRFTTKRGAQLWIRLRRQHADFNDAVRAFVNTQR